jgi:hypothetical protein
MLKHLVDTTVACFLSFPFPCCLNTIDAIISIFGKAKHLCDPLQTLLKQVCTHTLQVICNQTDIGAFPDLIEAYYKLLHTEVLPTFNDAKQP